MDTKGSIYVAIPASIPLDLDVLHEVLSMIPVIAGRREVQIAFCLSHKLDVGRLSYYHANSIADVYRYDAGRILGCPFIVDRSLGETRMYYKSLKFVCRKGEGEKVQPEPVSSERRLSLEL